MNFTTRCLSAAAACAAMVGGYASAGSISYGDFSDIPPGVVMYLDVSESSDNAPVFGAPTVTGNTIDWDPGAAPANQFIASTGGAGGTDSIDGQLNFNLMTLPGTGLTSLFIDESGDYDLFGAGGTTGTLVGAGIFIEIDILEVDGVALTTPVEVVDSSFISFNFADDTPGNPGVLGSPWSNSLFVDLGAALFSNGISYTSGVTKAEVTINDSLAAVSEPSTIAEIVKKDFTIIPGGDLDPDRVVPEPASLGLVLLGAGLMAVRRRR